MYSGARSYCCAESERVEFNFELKAFKVHSFTLWCMLRGDDIIVDFFLMHDSVYLLGWGCFWFHFGYLRCVWMWIIIILNITCQLAAQWISFFRLWVFRVFFCLRYFLVILKVVQDLFWASTTTNIIGMECILQDFEAFFFCLIISGVQLMICGRFLFYQSRGRKIFLHFY